MGSRNAAGESPTADQTEQRGRQRWKMVVGRVVTLVLLGLGIHLLLPQFAALEQSVQTIRAMAWWAVALAVLAQTFSYSATAYAMQKLAQSATHRISLWSALGIQLAGNSFGLIAGGPVATSAAQYRWLREKGVEPIDAAVTGGILIQLNNLMVALASLIGIFHLLMRHQLTHIEVAGLGIVAAAIVLTVAGFVLGRRHPEALVQTLVRTIGPVARLLRRPFRPERLDATVRAVLSVWDRRKEHGWARPLLGALGGMIFDMLTLLALFAAAGYPVGLGTLLVGYGLPLLLGKVTFLPGGVGIVEASMATLYGGLGVPHDVLVVVVLAYRFCSFWAPNLIGFVLIFLLGHGAGRRRGANNALRAKGAKRGTHAETDA